MRLTNTLRDAFVRAAMADVPQIDYKEKLNALALKAAKEVMPTAVRAAYDRYPAYFETHYKRIGNQIDYSLQHTVFVPMVGEFSDTVNAEAAVLKAADNEQAKKMYALEQKLKGVAASVTTRKALVEALPEFEKYLPPAEVKTSGLPALANLVSDFVEAGWPKGRKEAVATA